MAWDRSNGRIGANVGYFNLNASGTTISSTNYGAYGEFYPNSKVTLGLRGGGDTISTGGASRTGGYFGGEGIIYAMPNLALTGTVGYASVSSIKQTSAGIRGEWLFSEKTPISGWIGYDYSSLKVGGPSFNANLFSVGLKVRFGGSGSLEHRQRTGVDDWGSSTVRYIF